MSLGSNLFCSQIVWGQIGIFSCCFVARNYLQCSSWSNAWAADCLHCKQFVVNIHHVDELQKSRAIVYVSSLARWCNWKEMPILILSTRKSILNTLTTQLLLGFCFISNKTSKVTSQFVLSSQPWVLLSLLPRVALCTRRTRSRPHWVWCPHSSWLQEMGCSLLGRCRLPIPLG